MKALMEHLTKLEKDDKVVVFSQFLGFLDLLEKQIKNKNLKFVVIILYILENVR